MAGETKKFYRIRSQFQLRCSEPVDARAGEKASVCSEKAAEGEADAVAHSKCGRAPTHQTPT